MTIYAPVNVKEQQKGGASIGKKGRDEQYRQIRSLVAELLLYNRGGTIMLLGGHGSGKTVLVDALAEFAKRGSMLLLTSKLDEEKKLRNTSVTAVSNRQSVAACRRGSTAQPQETGPSHRPPWFSAALQKLTQEEEAKLGIVSEGLGFFAWKDVVAEVLENADASKKLGKAQFVREALLAEQAFMEREILALKADSLTDEPNTKNDYCTRFARKISSSLASRGWLLNELLPEKHTVLLPPSDDDAPISLTDCCLYIQAMVIALLRFVSTGSPMVASQQAMVLIHIRTSSSTEAKVDVWSWRTASTLSTQCSNRKMNLLFAVVTRAIAPLSDVDMSSSDPRVEVYRSFNNIETEVGGWSEVALLVAPAWMHPLSAIAISFPTHPRRNGQIP